MNTRPIPQPHVPRIESRRDFLFQMGAGFGGLALATMLHEDGVLGSETTDIEGNPLAPKPTHFRPRAKSVIFLFMEGGPSHIDTFDPKPTLNRLDGQPLPDTVERVITPMGVGNAKLLGSRRKWQQHGQAGTWVSDWLPHTARHVDDIAVIRSCWANGLNHVGSVCQMNTGSILAGRPSLGSWVIYGLGTVNQNLPGFVVLTDGNGTVSGGARNWGTGYMPATFQGTHFRSSGPPVLNLNPPREIAGQQQRNRLDLLNTLNRRHRDARPNDSELGARIASYELAYRMQSAAPEVVDLSRESARTKEAYGLNYRECREYGHRCLLARRLVERGVRFVQIYCGTGSKWDAHSGLERNHTQMCKLSDQPTAALLQDLKQRGLFEDTLVIWGGEFGRTPMTEGRDGRDHNPYGFTMWMAGGGIKPGVVYGTTDEFGLHAVEGRAHVHDLHATMLDLLGFNHEHLTFFHNGREQRLTDVGGHVIRDILA